MTHPSPFFTIIVATRNAESCIKKLLTSLCAQKYKNFSVIIQDGISTDGTLEIAKRAQRELSQLTIYSAADSGIYDAWNRAIKNVNENLGEWVLFLGADDQLFDETVLERAHFALASQPKFITFGAGALQMISTSGRVLPDIFSPEIYAYERVAPMRMPVPFLSLFIRNSVFSGVQFNTTYRIAGDYDFLLRTWKKRTQGIRLNFVVSYMTLGGISTQHDMARCAAEETVRARKENCILQRVFFIPMDHINRGIYPYKLRLKEICKKNCLLYYCWKSLVKFRKKFFSEI